MLKLESLLRVSWPLSPEVTNTALEKLLYPKRDRKDTSRMFPDFQRIHRELAEKGVTLSLLWTEYCAEAQVAGKIPYMSPQFGDLYRKWARVSSATMCIQRKPGETFEVDWAGKARLFMMMPQVLRHLPGCLWAPCPAAAMSMWNSAGI